MTLQIKNKIHINLIQHCIHWFQGTAHPFERLLAIHLCHFVHWFGLGGEIGRREGTPTDERIRVGKRKNWFLQEGEEGAVKATPERTRVAQLEEIRLQSQMDEYVSSLNSPFCSNLNMEHPRVEMAPSSSSPLSRSGSSSFALRPNTMVRFGDAVERGIVHYGEHWSRSHLDQRRSVSSSHCYVPPTLTLSLFEQNIEEDSAQKRDQRDARLGSISQSSDTNDAQELDLDLKLSL
ncbi:hypothetical protein MUK42_17037 [Musa troglodytarum]|uniref:Uncharacterized protein n=2 Tax=Musa troglodytarum TaxID=320322 RepID=A0A9E7H715_9LILI|nr:hypothetical protein MUK42_17037 [Musa troglodytarum]